MDGGGGGIVFHHVATVTQFSTDGVVIIIS